MTPGGRASSRPSGIHSHEGGRDERGRGRKIEMTPGTSAMNTASCTCGEPGAVLGPPLVSMGRNGTRFHVRPCQACARGLLDPCHRPRGCWRRTTRRTTAVERASSSADPGGHRVVPPAPGASRAALPASSGTSAPSARHRVWRWRVPLRPAGDRVGVPRDRADGGHRATRGRHRRPRDPYRRARRRRLRRGRFDVMSLWHVLEHLADPDRTLRDCARWLTQGGLLLVAVPNLDSWQARVFRGAWFHLDPPFHLHHFAPGSLARALWRRRLRAARDASPVVAVQPVRRGAEPAERGGFHAGRALRGAEGQPPLGSPGRIAQAWRPRWPCRHRSR